MRLRCVGLSIGLGVSPLILTLASRLMPHASPHRLRFSPLCLPGALEHPSNASTAVGMDHKPPSPPPSPTRTFTPCLPCLLLGRLPSPSFSFSCSLCFNSALCTLVLNSSLSIFISHFSILNSRLFLTDLSHSLSFTPIVSRLQDSSWPTEPGYQA